MEHFCEEDPKTIYGYLMVASEAFEKADWNLDELTRVLDVELSGLRADLIKEFECRLAERR